MGESANSPPPPPAPRRAYALTVALLVATVPLLPAEVGPLGLPLWALGSLVVTAVYAITVAVALGRHFGDSDGDGRS